MRPLAPLRFGDVHTLPPCQLSQLEALATLWKTKQYQYYFVTEHPRDPLGKVVALTDKDALMAQHAMEGLQDYGSLFQKPWRKRGDAGFKNLHYWFARKLTQLTHSTTPSELGRWYLETPENKIKAIHTILADWLTQHYKPRHTVDLQADLRQQEKHGAPPFYVSGSKTVH